MANTKLSVYLVKRGFSNPEEYIDLDKDPIIQEVPPAGTLYVKPSYPSTPKWVTSFFGGIIDTEYLVNSSVCAALAVSIPDDNNDRQQRTFLITFGYGRVLCRREALDERFGLRTVLNIAESDSLRKINRTTVAGSAMKTNEQLPNTSQFSDFAIDTERDLLNKVTVSIDGAIPHLGNMVTGSDSLSFNTDARLDSIKDLLKQLLELSYSDKYKVNFPFIDQILPVKDPVLIDALDNEVIRCVNDGDERIWMAVPEVIEWEDTAGFKIPKVEGLQQDILIADVLSSLDGMVENVDELKRRKIAMKDIDGKHDKKRWSAYRCLYGEIDFAGRQYCITDGCWYQIDDDYSAHINNDYGEMTVSAIDFPNCPANMRENDYNAILANSGEEHYVLMDAEFIYHGGGRSKFELCDVLTDCGQYIHVKKYGNSSVLSHLFNQGFVSARLVKSDNLFVDKAAQKVAEVSPEFAMEISKDSLKEVVFGIITDKQDNPPHIPFFSKVALHSVKNQLVSMGIVVSIKSIYQLPS